MCVFVIGGSRQKVKKGSWLGPLARIIEVTQKGGGPIGTHIL